MSPAFKKSNSPILIAILISLLTHISFLLLLSSSSQTKPKFGLSYANKQRQKKDKGKPKLNPLSLNVIHGMRKLGQERETKAQAKRNPISSAKVENINRAIQNRILYPRLAVRMGWEGELSIKVKVSSGGLVDQVSLIKSSGFRVLDQAAIDAVHKWSFEKSEKESTFPLHFAFELR